MAGFEEINVPLIHNKGMSQLHTETHDRAEGCASQLVHAAHRIGTFALERI